MTSLPEETGSIERTIRTFEDLDVWRFCRELRTELTVLAKQLPNTETFRLADQIIRAARSVTNNIAEGYGRFHYQENIQFCRQSRGSLYELIDHVCICLDEGFISHTESEELKEKVLRAVKLVNGYVRYLTKRKSEKTDPKGD